jgi:choline dehydrogenase-like flavoprotein
LATDVCIIGAGPAGLTIARQLLGRGLRIAVLERGGPPGRPLGLICDGVTAADSDFEAPPMIPPRFGGGANEWIVRLPWLRYGVRMVPLSPIDLEARPWIPDSGWPIGWDELERYYRRAHSLLKLGRWGYDVETWETDAQRRLPLEAAGFTTAMEHFSRSDIFTREAWHELEAADDVTVFLHAPVGSLNGSPDHIDHLELDAGERNRLRMTAQVYVLACGSLDNSRLLLSANGGRGIGEANDVVGHYYMDHLRFISGELTPSGPKMFGRTGLYDIRSTPAGVVMGKLVPTDELLRSEELLQSGATLLPRVRPEIESALDEVTSALGALRRWEWPERFPSTASIARVASLLAGTVPEMAIRQRRFPPRTDAGWSSTSRNDRRYSRFTVEHQVEQAPDPSNRVRLGPSGGEFGRPTVELSWRWGELDLFSARETQRLFGEAVEKTGTGTFTPTAWTEHPPLTTPSGAYHPMGTTRMNPSPRRGVVDANSRVHGQRNLFVAGNSVFPTGGYANPTFTLVAMSMRLADFIIRGVASHASLVHSIPSLASFFCFDAFGAGWFR